MSSSRQLRGVDSGSRAALLARLAPPAPPCFSSRDQWVTFLDSAGVGQRVGRPPRPGPDMRPLLLDGPEPRFNPGFEFCADCTPCHRLRMVRQGKCDPDALRSRADAEHARVMRLVDAELAEQAEQELAS